MTKHAQGEIKGKSDFEEDADRKRHTLKHLGRGGKAGCVKDAGVNRA